ncbi:Uncharacterised protein [Mycobacteroides abscessus subsp. abscessus]|nr:Uncharacterised protein [Mycobacteroides abscessus subsp. abscessus]
MAGNDTGGLCTLRRPDGTGSEVAVGSTTASGNSWRSARTSGIADSKMEAMCSGPARKSSMARFWMATVEYSRHIRCLMVALIMLPNKPRMLLSQCRAATTNRLRKWK